MGCQIPFLSLKFCDFIRLLVRDTEKCGFLREWWGNVELIFLRLALIQECPGIIFTEILLGRDNVITIELFIQQILDIFLGGYFEQHWGGQNMGLFLEMLTVQSNLLIYTWETSVQIGARTHSRWYRQLTAWQEHLQISSVQGDGRNSFSFAWTHCRNIQFATLLPNATSQ